MALLPRIKVSQLAPAMQIEQVFMISQPQLRTTSRGDYYIAAYLSDSTGKLNGRMWQATEAIFQSLPNEGFVMVKGRTENYQNSLQMVVDAIRPVDVDEIDPQDFVPSTDKDVDVMFARVKELLDPVKNADLKRLIQAFLADENLMGLFRKAPAAIALHHAYLGGLLEHTLSMMETATQIIPCYPDLDGDLVIAAVFLHDIGKTTELAYDVSFKYSDQGQLLGHIVKGTMMIQEKVQQLNADAQTPFDPVLLDRLMHIIVSHHGIREYGCPVLPATPEAFAVHYLDNLDAKLNLCFTQIQNDNTDTNWTAYIRSIETRLFKPRLDS